MALEDDIKNLTKAVQSLNVSVMNLTAAMGDGQGGADAPATASPSSPTSATTKAPATSPAASPSAPTPAADSPSSPDVVNFADLQRLAVDTSKKLGNQKGKIPEAMQTYTTSDGVTPVTRISDLRPEDYASFAKDLQRLAAEVGNG